MYPQIKTTIPAKFLLQYHLVQLYLTCRFKAEEFVKTKAFHQNL